MPRLTMWFLLLIAATLGGCDLAKQPFSCSPGLTRRIDADQLIYPAHRDAQGYYHC